MGVTCLLRVERLGADAAVHCHARTTFWGEEGL
jgi:hypothetical protein